MTKKTFIYLFLCCCCSLHLTAQSRFSDEKTGKTGLENKEWEVIIPAIYDELVPMYYGRDSFVVVTKDGRKGVFKINGQQQVPVIYQELEMWLQPFGFQHGFSVITQNRDAGTAWGMLDQNGKMILPEKFEYLRAIDPDLLVARKFADSTLQFFNGQGKPLFQIFGRKVLPGYNDQTIQIEQVNRTKRWADKKGNWLFPANAPTLDWTDGKLEIGGDFDKKGVRTVKGDTLVPFIYREIDPANKGHFFVKTADYKIGLADDKGRLIIPLTAGELYRFGNIEGGFYIQNSPDNDPVYANNLYDPMGKLLFQGVRISTVSMSSDISFLPGNQRGNYFSVAFKDQQKLIFHQTRGQLLTDKWRDIWYGGEKRPLIAVNRDTSGYAVQVAVFDLQGRLLLQAPSNIQIEHTINPDLLRASNSTNKTADLIRVGKTPNLSGFRYARITPLSNGYFVANHETGGKILLNQDGVEINNTGLNSIDQPGKAQMLQYRSTKGASGKLVAVGRRPGMVYTSWIGINHRGEVFVFEKNKEITPEKSQVIEAPKPEISEVMEASEPRMLEVRDTRVMEASEPTMLEATDAPPPPPPAKGTDEIFTIPEKQAAFPGGEEALSQFLKNNMVYPTLAKENGIEGRVVISFVVEKNGTRSDIKIVRDIGGGCAKEAIRLVEMMPNWIPAQQNGVACRVKYTLPVTFRI